MVAVEVSVNSATVTVSVGSSYSVVYKLLIVLELMIQLEISQS